MNFTNHFSLTAIFWAAIAQAAVAFSCAPLEPDVGALSGDERKQAIVEEWYKTLLSDDPSRMIVFGTFEKTQDLPFIHEVERRARLDRWQANGWSEKEIIGGIEYTYWDVFRFSGVQIVDGKEIPFMTSSTMISIDIDGDLELGKMPATGAPVLGKMWKTSSPYFELDSSACLGYRQISQVHYDLLLDCLAIDGCAWNRRNPIQDDPATK